MSNQTLPAEFWIDGHPPTKSTIKYIYQKLPSPAGYTCSLPYFQEPKALQHIWEGLRTATFDYSARSAFLMPPPACIIEKVFLVFRSISPSKIPGTTIATRHAGLSPRLEFARRNRCALAYKQDENAIAALTGPIARLLGPAGFKVEEALVRINDETRIKRYHFQEGWGANIHTDGIAQAPELLVFKATHLKDPNRVYAIAPTGVRFGWNFTTMRWDTFVLEYTTDVVYTQRLGRTRENLDSVALFLRGDADIATLPRAVVKILLAWEARMELREVLNRFCEMKGYRLHPERMLNDYEEVGRHVNAEMRAWMEPWKREYRQKRLQYFIARTRAAPGKLARSLKKLPQKLLRGWKRLTGKAAPAPEQPGDRYPDASGEEEGAPLLGSAADDDSRPSTGDSSSAPSDMLGMRGGSSGKRSEAVSERGGADDESLRRAGALEWAPDARRPGLAVFREAASTPTTMALLDSGWPADAHSDGQQTQTAQAPTASSLSSDSISQAALDTQQQQQQQRNYGTFASSTAADAQTSTTAATTTVLIELVSDSDSDSEETADPSPSLSTIMEEEDDGADTDEPWNAAKYAAWDPWVRHWFWCEISDVYRRLAGEGVVGPVDDDESEGGDEVEGEGESDAEV